MTPTLPVLLPALALAGLLLAVSAARADDDDDDPAPAAGPAQIELLDGVPVVRLPRDLQQRGGLETASLEAATHTDERPAYAEVVDLGPLLEQRAAWRQLLAEQRVARATLAASRQDYERLRSLREQRRYVSDQDLVAAQARWESDEARAGGMDAQAEDLRAQMLQMWGPTLTSWALDGGGPAFDSLVARQEVLLLVSLRAGDTLPEGTTEIRVGRGDEPGRFVPATLVSSAPRTDPAFQGETWWFRAPAGRLRIGMRVDARIPTGAAGQAGVAVPVAAIVWHGGEPWVYVQLDDERYARRALEDWRERGDTWFVADALEPGERVVVRGAQMLLSEEFRWQIPSEDDD